MKQKLSFKYIIALQAAVILYTCTDIAAKLASNYPFLSMGFVLSYGVEIMLLGVYALVWQQIIKRMPLTTAFANKAFTVVWGLVFGVLFFEEKVTAGKLAGIALVVLGVILYAGTDQGAEDVE